MIPKIDYMSRDFATIRSDLVKLIPQLTNQWTDYNADDVGIVLIELFSYISDILHLYGDRLANESFLSTAQSRQSVKELLKLIGYNVSPQSSSVGKVQFKSTEVSEGDILQPEIQVSTTDGIFFNTLNQSTYKYRPPYYCAKKNECPEPYGKDWDGNGLVAFYINGSSVHSINFNSCTGYPDEISADDFVARINMVNGKSSDFNNLYTITNDGNWIDWCYLENFGGTTTLEATNGSVGSLLVDEDATFEDYHIGCYITKGGFGTAGTYEGKIIDVIDKHTIRTSLDTYTLSGSTPSNTSANWVSGDAYQIYMVPARVESVGGKDYINLVGTKKDSSGDFYYLRMDELTNYEKLSGIGIEDVPESGIKTYTQYLGAEAYILNAQFQKDEIVGRSSGEPFQSIRLIMDNVSFHLGYENIATKYEVELEIDEGEGYESWERVNNFTGSTYTDKHYIISVSEEGKSMVIFGDGISGKIPKETALIKASYYYGGEGNQGNVGKYTISEVVSDIDDDSIEVINFFPTIGGKERESLVSAKINASRYISTLDRAVSKDDFEYLTEKYPGVAVAVCENLVDLAGVNVCIIPENWDGKSSNWMQLITEVENYLERKKVVGTSIVVGLPEIIGINVTYDIVLKKGYNQIEVETDVERKIKEFLSPLREVDGIYVDSIGKDVYLDEMIDFIREVDGVKNFRVLEFYDEDSVPANDSEGEAVLSKIGIPYTATDIKVRMYGDIVCNNTELES